MTETERSEAVDWLVKGYDIITVAQHFDMTRDELARELNTEIKSPTS